MRSVFQTLGEKEKRRYAAVEAIKLPHGGIQYIAEVLGCSRRTIERGIEELDELPDDPAAGKQRRPGGGRKKATEEKPDLPPWRWPFRRMETRWQWVVTIG